MKQDKIGKFILHLRKEHGMTQQELANLLNVTDRAVSHWENGRSIPDILLFKRICEIFDISVNELVCGEKISKERIEDASNENIINALKDNDTHKKKSRNIIMFLIFGIICLLVIVLSFIKNKYPKIDLFNYTSQISDVEKPYKLEKVLTIDDRDVYYYGIDIALFCDKHELCYSVIDALKHKQITLSEFQEYLENQVKYENYDVIGFYDGGTKVYSKNGIEIMYCNTIDGNKDVYFGNDLMIDNLDGEYCGKKKNEVKSYTRTYKVISSSIYKKDSEFNEIIIENIDGKIGKVIVNNSYSLIPGHIYNFSFLTFDEIEDNIESIFLNSTLLTAKEIDLNSKWVNEKIIVNNNDYDNTSLNELENVNMSIIEGTLSNTSLKLLIKDYSNNKYVYGNNYRIDKKIENRWYEVDRKNEMSFNLIAYHPDLNGNLEFDINWEYSYGNLDSGTYRIVKYAILQSDKCTQQCTNYQISVEFEI